MSSIFGNDGMTLLKGELHHYAATGETPHFYIWTGTHKAKYHDWEYHVPVLDGDILYINKDLIFRFFEYNKPLSKKDTKILKKALKENWVVELVTNI